MVVLLLSSREVGKFHLRNLVIKMGQSFGCSVFVYIFAMFMGRSDTETEHLRRPTSEAFSKYLWYFDD